ncbi:MAG: YraN family protein [Nitriliruptor sp.]|nr:MAG: YraN family protein [Nitriliruptor sp.]
MDTTTAHQVTLTEAEREALISHGALGRAGEALAARHLGQDDRLQVLARNWRIADGALRGELDVVAVDPTRGTLVVCEVKTRRDADRFGGAVAALDHRKHRQLRSLTAAFLREQGGRFASVRLDLVAIDVGRRPRLTHIVGLG